QLPVDAPAEGIERDQVQADDPVDGKAGHGCPYDCVLEPSPVISDPVVLSSSPATAARPLFSRPSAFPTKGPNTALFPLASPISMSTRTGRGRLSTKALIWSEVILSLSGMSLRESTSILPMTSELSPLSKAWMASSR